MDTPNKLSSLSLVPYLATAPLKHIQMHILCHKQKTLSFGQQGRTYNNVVYLDFCCRPCKMKQSVFHYSPRCTGDEYANFSKQAAQDWVQILRQREKELAKGEIRIFITIHITIYPAVGHWFIKHFYNFD